MVEYVFLVCLKGLICLRNSVSIPGGSLTEGVQSVELEFGRDLKQERVSVLVLLIHPIDYGIDCSPLTHTVLVVDAQKRLCWPELESLRDLNVSYAENQAIFWIDAVTPKEKNLWRVESHHQGIIAPIEPRNTESGPSFALRYKSIAQL